MSSKLPVAAIGAWLLVAVYYFYQYALRSAPSLMTLQLTDAFRVNALGVSVIVGISTTAIRRSVWPPALRWFGAKRVIPIGAAVVGIGAILFDTGNAAAANIGRFCKAPAERSRSSARFI